MNAFDENMRALLGGEYEAFAEAMLSPPARAIRLNPSRAYSCPGERVPWCETGRYITAAKPGASLEHFAGCFYVQEPSAMAPAEVMSPEAGWRVLDLCAAPGGKATRLAEKCAFLLANEIEPKRANILASNIERMGRYNCAVTNESPDRLAAALPGAFDAVLVDAPCSGEGMFRRDPQAVAEWTEKSNEGCARRQRDILRAARALLRPGGRLVYSTCTFSKLENEDNIEWLLREFPDFEPEDFSLSGVGASAGGMLRLWPHKIRGEGHFVARLRLGGEAKISTVEKPRERDASGLFSNLPDGYIEKRGDEYSYISPLCPELAGLRVIMRGTPLYTIKKGVLRPEHAAAMAFEAANNVELDETLANQYLSGQELGLEDSGWARACFHGYPLGWGKLTQGAFKNHLPKGLRQNSILSTNES